MTEKHPWHSSLTFKIIASCVVLFLCLAGAIYVASSELHQQTVQEMRTASEKLAEELSLLIREQGPEKLSDLSGELGEFLPGFGALNEGGFNFEIRIGEEFFEFPPKSTTASDSEDEGPLARIHVQSKFDTDEGERVEISMWTVVPPYTEILERYQAHFLWILAVLFVIALAALCYWVLRMLRPLRELTDACSQIREGNLKSVAVDRNSREIILLEEKFNEMIGSLKEKEVMEKRLNRAQKLSALGTLAAGIAHDIGNPLNAIKLIASHLADEGSKDSEGDGKTTTQYARTIVEEVGRMEKTVEGFLDLTRERKLQVHPVDLDRILEEIRSLVRRECQRRGINCDFDLNLNEVRTECDPELIKRTVLNLILNALDATPSDGRIRVRSGKENGYILIEVEDTGHGMDRVTLDRAFEPYFTTKPSGTGLGLALAHRIIEQHHGKIDLESAPGQGTRVRIRLKERFDLDANREDRSNGE